MARYLIDSNIFITAKNTFYQFGFAQCFWDFILELHKKGIVYSVKAVKDELLAPSKVDDLQIWVKALPDAFWKDHFLSINSYSKLMQYAQTLDVRDIAKQDFAKIENADAWIIAHAMENDFKIITEEKYNFDVKKRIMIPNVAKVHNVETVTLFEFMEEYAGHNFLIKLSGVKNE
ncbi:DUF4411 family protein [Gallibacterium anatis]|uniref:DUF4411 family protein n=1 Tax=Gallibacterium anatis TaxID=750 RepID=UPI000531C574|nr:DUF4411 family protein [Gallibacterium anatis]KGQ39952.1 hypothetical protein JP30_09075 [Gallibacterium anatis IPDH697-78]